MNDSPPKSRGFPRRRTLIAAVVAAVPLAPIAAGLVIATGGAGTGAAAKAAYTPVGAAPPIVAKPTPFDWKPRAGLAFVALLKRATIMRATPAGRTIAKVSLHTEYGSPEAMWVVRYTHGWLAVISPLAGNGRVGWIPLSSAALAVVTWRLKVSVSARRLTVLQNGRVVKRFTVAVGRPSAPTPVGRFDVTDRLATADSAGPYGCCILALSAHAPHAIQGWSGGDRIAIHSTTDSTSVGRPVSHGCLRVSLTAGRWLMDRIPLGTPVLISS